MKIKKLAAFLMSTWCLNHFHMRVQVCMSTIIMCKYKRNIAWGSLIHFQAERRKQDLLPYQRIPSRDVNLVGFFLFTRRTPIKHQVLKFDDLVSVGGSFFNPNVPTKVIVHGYDDQALTSWLINMKVLSFTRHSTCDYYWALFRTSI